MPEVKIKRGEWVVVCDGAKAILLENVGDAKFPNLQTKEVYEQEDLKTREQGTDAPGRAINSVGAVRSAMEQTDWHDQSERSFLADLAHRLEEAINAGKARTFIVVAPPRALGVMRKLCSARVRDALRAEIDKDLVKLPVHEIERHLTAR
jgi:protein required for attachment to host cells